LTFATVTSDPMAAIGALADAYPWDVVLVLVFIAYLCTEQWRWR